MLRKAFQDRCANPFNLMNHKIVKGLRIVSKNLQEKWNLLDDIVVCPSCRMRLTSTSPGMSDNVGQVNARRYPIQCNPSGSSEDPAITETLANENISNDDEVPVIETLSFESDTNEVENPIIIDTECLESHTVPFLQKDDGELGTQSTTNSESTSQSKSETTTEGTVASQASNSSQVSIEVKLPTVNQALQWLDNSPIPAKKLRLESWVQKKVDRVACNLGNLLGTHTQGMNEEIRTDASHFRDLMQKLIEKFKSDNIDRSQKLQILTLLPENMSVRKIASIFRTTEYMVEASRTLVAMKGILALPDKKCGKKINENTRIKVIDFYEDSRNSATMPGKKDSISVLKEDGSRGSIQKKLILSNLKELYESFRQENLEDKIGFSLFASLRPAHCVSAGASGTHTVCVCSIHHHIKLMIIGAELHLGDTVVGSLNHYKKCTDAIICKNPATSCHFGNCPSCPGIDYLRRIISSFLDENGIEEIRYKQWVTKPRTTLETFVKSSMEYVEAFCDKMKGLLPHAYAATMQGNYMKSVKSTLDEHECLVICEFAENYAFVIQDAAPGFHWNNNQVSIYTVVIYTQQKN